MHCGGALRLAFTPLVASDPPGASSRGEAAWRPGSIAAVGLTMLAAGLPLMTSEQPRTAGRAGRS